MDSQIYNVLFLCTGNTARSILAEGILRKDGAGSFNAFSAGSQPKGAVNPYALKTLAAYGYPGENFRSKSWDEYAAPGAPKMDFVFTVCDNAAGEVCPFWPGQPMTAHWGIEDVSVSVSSQAPRLRPSWACSSKYPSCYPSCVSYSRPGAGTRVPAIRPLGNTPRRGSPLARGSPRFRAPVPAGRRARPWPQTRSRSRPCQPLAHRPGERAPAAQRLPDRDFHPGRAAAAFCLRVLSDSYASA